MYNDIFSLVINNWVVIKILQYRSKFDAAYLHHWLSETIHFNRYNLCFLQVHRMWEQMQTVVFHGFAYTCCTVFFQPFCGMFTIRFNVLNGRVFPHRCYRTLTECKGSGFLGISVCYIGIYTLEYLIRLKKCNKLWLIHWETCNLFQLFV